MYQGILEDSGGVVLTHACRHSQTSSRQKDRLPAKKMLCVRIARFKLE